MYKSLTAILIFACVLAFNGFADRIYIMNASGYNAAGAELITAIANNGHTVTNNTVNLTSLPVGFTTTCVDPVNGYDWLCFFGVADFSGLQPDIQAFIDQGGKVFYQYEVSCCITSANSAASIVSGLTGLNITPNPEPYISFSGGPPGWEAVGCCLTITGAAYRCFDGIPAQNGLMATADLNGALPSYTTCSNYGFVFSSADFASGQNRGGIIGFGDVNIWYDGGEPWSNGGANPVNPAVVDFIFPNNGSSCFVFPPGCSNQAISGNTGMGGSVSLGSDQGLCPGDTIVLNAGSMNTSYLWQDNSTNQTFEVTTSGTYWVEVTGACGSSSDTIEITDLVLPSVDLGPDLPLCEDSVLTLNATLNNASGFTWQDGSSDTTFVVNQEGIYWVEAVNICGNAVDSVEVYNSPPPQVDLGDDLLICEGEQVVLDATTAGATYEWQNGATSPQISVSAQGEYWVTVIVGNCMGMDTIEVFTELCNVVLDMPNIITPNSDLTNDYFVPRNMEGIITASVVIVNRWGNTVYENDDITLGWDGRSDGRECSEGTYFWVVNYTDQFGESGTKHGFVTLTR